ncbi:hypothetical protein DERP_004137 [Dermatophagoides pteronyssinus]|uniref:Transmembrane protein 107 n=1 Tax=Dermatophagoides pteronyssinus TaxID=6956 RepID=A0ABQ8J8W9_DERPT|nr:hypothetical protein DERP_004137 [Dermatophagoides pteronyssinus]
MNKWIISLRFISLVAHLVLVILFISNRVTFCLHTFGTISLTSFILDGWQCQLFWWLFVGTILLPFLTESYIVIHTILLLYNTNLTYM